MISVTVKTISLDKGLSKALAAIEGAGKTEAHVGYPSPSPQHPESYLNMASLALCMEKGFYNHKVHRFVPGRPFMEQTAEKNQAEARAMLAKAAKLIVEGKRTPKQAMEAIGRWYAGKMSEIFDTGSFRPNSDFTILMKGSSQPLIDMGDLRRAIRSKVVSGNGRRE